LEKKDAKGGESGAKYLENRRRGDFVNDRQSLPKPTWNFRV